MATILRKLPIKFPGSVAGTFTPSDEEVEIFRDSRVLNWWRAEEGFTDEGWQCRKTGFVMQPYNTVLPSKVTLPAFNNKEALQFGSGVTNGTMSSGAIPLLPVNADFSIVVVFSNTASDNAFYISNGLPANGAGNTYLQVGNVLSTSFRVGGASAISSRSGETPLSPAASPHLIEYSMADSVNSANIRIDNGLFNYINLSAVNQNPNGVLFIGAGIDNSGFITGQLDGGHIAEVIILNVASHLPANHDIRDKIAAYAMDRYSI